MANLFRILSIDGGGIRGIIPAMVLARIEQETNTPVWKLFDLIAGTSTGGILALALTMPADSNAPPDQLRAKYSASDAVEIFTANAARIFPYPPAPFRHTDLDFILSARYRVSGIETVLKEYASETRLKDALRPIIVTSYDIERAKAWFFSSEEARANPQMYDFPMWQVARATSAAPVYFPPLRLETPGPQQYYPLVDGGVAANNPAMCAFVEAMSSFNQHPNTILVVSLGTGELGRPLLYDSVKAGGLAQWGASLLNVLFDGNNQTVQYQMRTLLNQPGAEQRYYRFQTLLGDGANELDNAHPDNIRQLIDLGGNLADASKDQLKQLYIQLGVGPGVAK